MATCIGPSFGRAPLLARPGWSQWGNEIDSELDLWTDQVLNGKGTQTGAAAMNGNGRAEPNVLVLTEKPPEYSP